MSNKKEYFRKYYINHKEDFKKRASVWTKANPEKRREIILKSNKKRAKKIKAFWKSPRGKRFKKKDMQRYLSSLKGITTREKYKKSPSGIVAKKKVYAKRKLFGFIPLNKYFLGAEGHHINYNYVIYIPEKIHKSIWHCLASGVGMDKINKKAFNFLFGQGEGVINMGD